MSDARFIQWNKTQFTYTINGVLYDCVTRRKGIDLSAPDEEILVTKLIGIGILGIPQSYVECSLQILECQDVALLKEQEKAIQSLHKASSTYTKRTEIDEVTGCTYISISKAKSLATEWLVACLHSIMRVGDNKAISSLYTLASMQYNDIMPTEMYKHMISPWKDSSRLGRNTLPVGVPIHLYTKTVACMLMTLKDNYELLESSIFSTVSDRYTDIQPISASVKRFHNSVLSVISVTKKEYSQTLQLFHVGKNDIENAVAKLISLCNTKESTTTSQEEKVGTTMATKEFSRAMSTIIEALDREDELQAGLYAIKRNSFITDIHKIFNLFLTNERISENEAERRIESFSLLGSKEKQALLVIEVSHGLRTDCRTYPFMQGIEVPARSVLGKITGTPCKTLIQLLLSDEADKYVAFLDSEGYRPSTLAKEVTSPSLPVSTKSTNTPRKDKRGVVLGDKTVKVLTSKMQEKVYGIVHSTLPIITLQRDTVYTIYEAEGAIN